MIFSICHTTDACPSVSPKAHELVATQAIQLLPDPLGSLLKPSTAQIAAAARNIPNHATAHDTMGGDNHFLLLDVAAKDASFESRRRAAEAFPKNVRDAIKLCEQTRRSECGRIPWAAIESYAALVVAFRANEQSRIVAESAALLHLAADATMPFNTTAFADTARPDGNPIQPDTSKARRFQHDLIEQAIERLTFESRPWPGRFQPVSDPVSAVFDTLLDAHADLFVFDAWPQTSRAGQTLGGDGFHWIESARNERAIDLLRRRIETGALLGGGLIHGAWTAAGQPLPDGFQLTDSSKPPSDPDTPANLSCRDPYCGSRNSTVFHAASCPHVGRIKPQNIVGFASQTEAAQAGRKPCRSCKPAEPHADR